MYKKKKGKQNSSVLLKERMIDNFRLRTRAYVILPYYLHVQVLHFENRKCVFTQLSWNLNIQTSVVGDHALKKM